MITIGDTIFKNPKTKQEEIFAFYLDISLSQIYYCLEHPSNKICNPLRTDINPSMGFKKITSAKGIDKIIATDFGNTHYRGDCIDWAGYALRKNSKNSKDFMFIINHILYHTILNKNSKIKRLVDTSIKPIEVKAKTKSVFGIVFRAFNDVDLKYWAAIVRDPENVETVLKENKVYVASYVEINGIEVYRFKKYDPCFIYYLGQDGVPIYQMYRPFTTDKKLKFRTNNQRTIQYITELKSADILLITKSRKDKITSLSLFLLPVPHTLAITSVSSESTAISDLEYRYINPKYKLIVAWMDYDFAGIMTGFKNKIIYNIDTFYLSNDSFILFNQDLRVIKNECKRLNVEVKDFYTYFYNIPKYNFKQKDLSDLMRSDKRLAIGIVNVLTKHLIKTLWMQENYL